MDDFQGPYIFMVKALGVVYKAAIRNSNIVFLVEGALSTTVDGKHVRQQLTRILSKVQHDAFLYVKTSIISYEITILALKCQTSIQLTSQY